MRTCVIINPNAGSADEAEAILGELHRRPDWTVLQTSAGGDASDLAAAALGRGFERVIAAGGDGTMNEVVNGLSAGLERVVVGILPLGTGNDLPRTLALPDDPLDALAVIEAGVERRLDTIAVRSAGDQTLCINVAAGGFTGQVDEVMTEEIKRSWGPLAYVRGAIQVLPDLTHYQTEICYDDGGWERVSALNIIVANGRTAGGGTAVAPLANPEDGLLDVVIVHSGTFAELTGVAARLIAGNYLNSDVVSLHRSAKVEIRSTPGMWFNIDGELLTKEPVTFEVMPKALRMIVGPDYVPEPLVEE